jgi:hypothetical protein
MRKAEREKRIQLPSRPAGMGFRAAMIAVSEMSGIPIEELCGWVLVTVRHNPEYPGAHELAATGDPDDLGWQARWLQHAAEDLRDSP